MKLLLSAALAIALLFPALGYSQATRALPSYFPPGIQQTSDAFEQRAEVMRMYIGTWQCNQTSDANNFLRFVAGDSMSIQTGITSTSSVTADPADMKIVLDNYVPRKDGSVQVTSLCSQRLMTTEQALADAEDLKQLAIKAAELDYEYYKVIYDLAVKARAEKLGISKEDLLKQLDEKVPGYDITFRELHHLPKPSRGPSDFIPRVLHLGYPTEIPGGILGVTWSNTGIVYYNPEARMLDYIIGKPTVMAHEMVHNNKNIQKFPMDEAFDVEMQASIPEGLWAEDKMSLPYHGYFSDLRQIDEIYFSFDFQQMEKDVFKYDLAGNVQYDRERYKYYFDQMQTIKKENLDFFQTIVIPEFYSDPLWWGAVNNIRGDNNSVFRMVMALHYDPTLLGGHDKTMQWLATHEDEIKDIAKEAFEAGLGKDQGGMDMNMVSMYQRMFAAKERLNIEAYFKAHPDKLKELRQMKPLDALQFVNSIKDVEVK